MKKAFILAIVFVLSSCSVYAEGTAGEEDTKVQKTICSPEPIIKTKPFFSSADADYGDQFAGSNNFCTDERITLPSSLTTIKNTITCICRDQSELERVGCSEGERQPTVTIIIPRAISRCVRDDITISKCAKDQKAAYEAACKSGKSASSIAGVDEIPDLTTDWGKTIPLLGGASGSEVLTQALTQRGLTKEEAQTLVSEQRETVANYVRALWDGDSTKAKAEAQKFNISPELLENLTALEPLRDPNNQQSNDMWWHRDYPPNRSETTGFNDDGTPRQSTHVLGGQCGVGGVEGRIMYNESGCGRNTYNPNSNVQGPYQFLCSSWNGYAQQTGNGQYSCSCTSGGYYAGRCDAVNDVNISTAVMRARDTQLQSQYGSLCSSAQLNWPACAYTIHFAGEAGFQRLLSAYKNDPALSLTPQTVDQMIVSGAYRANQSVFGRMNTVSDFFRWTDSKMNGQTAILSYSGGNIASQPRGLFSGFTASTQAEVSVYNALSPMASASLFGGMSLFSPNSGQFNPLTGYAQPYQPIQNQPFQPVRVTGTSNATSTITTPAEATATILAQPHTISAGGTISIVWASAGVSDSVPCTLAQNTQQIARSNSGSKSVTISERGTVTFTLSCIGKSGASLTKTDSVTVQ